MPSSLKVRLALFLAGFINPIGVSSSSCYLSTSMHGIPAQNLAYALQNVSCPVTTAANDLLDNNYVVSIPDSSKAIVATLQATTIYLNASAPITTPDDTDLYRGPLLSVPYEFTQWTSQLLKHRKTIQGDSSVASFLPGGLAAQKTAAVTFIDLVVAKTDASQRTETRNILATVLSDLDCAIKIFEPDSTATVCPDLSASGVASTSMSSGSSVSSSSVPQTSSSGTATVASTTSSSKGGAASAYPTEAVLAGLLFAWGAVPFV